MREKLLNLMKSEGLTSSRLAEILEIQPSGISHILSGRNKPGFDLLQKILRRFPRINPDWLLLDADRMYRDDKATATQFATDAPVGNVSGIADLFAPASEASTSPKKSALPNVPQQSAPELQQFAVQESNRADAVRIVVLYADQTFESFTVKK